MHTRCRCAYQCMISHKEGLIRDILVFVLFCCIRAPPALLRQVLDLEMAPKGLLDSVAEQAECQFWSILVLSHAKIPREIVFQFSKIHGLGRSCRQSHWSRIACSFSGLSVSIHLFALYFVSLRSTRPLLNLSLRDTRDRKFPFFFRAFHRQWAKTTYLQIWYNHAQAHAHALL